MIRLFFFACALLFELSAIGATNTTELPVKSYIYPAVETNFLSYSQRLEWVKFNLERHQGQVALRALAPLMRGKPPYDVWLLAAQSYAELDKPLDALTYYIKAYHSAPSPEAQAIATQGLEHMERWIRALMPSSLLSIQAKFAERAASMHRTQEVLKLSTKPVQAITPPSKFEQYALAAQTQAEHNNPKQALWSYQAALHAASNPQERLRAHFGIAKMQFWLGRYYKALHQYQWILNQLNRYPNDAEDVSHATAGLIKSLAYADRPIAAYHAIPSKSTVTTPDLVVAEAQATLWANQSDLSKTILTTNQSVIQTIDPNSSLGHDLQDLEWQVALNTHPYVATPSAFYSEDSEHFSVLRSTLDGRYYRSESNQSFVGLDQTRYKQHSAVLNAEGVYVRQQWKPTREWTVSGRIEPTTYQLWKPWLWQAYSNYRPSDQFGAQVVVQREVIETFPAFANHITDEQYATNVSLSPLPYTTFNGAVNRLNISDGNVRNGYFVAATTVLSTRLGLNLTLQQRGYTDKFVSSNYFSPNEYSANAVILRFGSKVNTVWHYYIDGGLGTQRIGITGSPTTTSPTRQIGFGFNGPLNRFVVLSACYVLSQQASAFIDSPNYRYQYGAISFSILL